MSSHRIDNESKFNYIDGDVTITGSVYAPTVSATQVSAASISSSSGGVGGVMFPTTTGVVGQTLVLDNNGDLQWQTMSSTMLSNVNAASYQSSVGVDTNDHIDVTIAAVPLARFTTEQFYIKDTASENIFRAEKVAGEAKTTVRNALFLENLTANSVAIKAPASVIDYTLTLPTGLPSQNGQMVVSDINGQMSWMTPSILGVTSTGAPQSVGSGDAQPVNIVTNGQERLQITSTGDIQLLGDMTNSRTFKLLQADNSASIGFKAPDTGLTNYTMTLPAAQGSASTALVNNGSGSLSWQPVLLAGTNIGPISLSSTSSLSLVTNSANALILDGGNAITLKMAGTTVANIDATTIAPQTTDTVSLGSSSKRFNTLNAKAFQLFDSPSGFKTQVNVPNLSADTTFILPPDNGSTAKVLTTNGSGTTTWAYPTRICFDAQTITSSTTLDTRSLVLVNAVAGSVQVTLPAATSNSGQAYYIYKTDSSANTVTIAPSTGETLDGTTNATVILTTQDDRYYVLCSGIRGWFAI